MKRRVAAGSVLGLLSAVLIVASSTCSDLTNRSDRDGDSIRSDVAATGALGGLALYSEPDSRALTTVAAWKSSRPADAALIEKMARTPQGTWFNGWQPDPRAAAASLAAEANGRGAVPLLVIYNIPNRDCGEYSAGGAASAAAYQSFVQSIAEGIRGRKTIVVLEPDAVPDSDCLTAAAQSARFAMIRNAVHILAGVGAWVYIDAGHSGWQSDDDIANWLKQSGIGEAAGFSVNVSNFVRTEDNIRFGEALSALVGGKHYIIDTSRNGLGPASGNEWCNPAGRATGDLPTTTTGRARLDALAWVKNPGDSDGPCNGGPAAGEWYPEYALGLMKRAR